MDQNHFKKLENMYATAPINLFYEPILKIESGKSELQIRIQPKFFHAANATHGSVYFKALDDSAFFAVNSLVEDVFVLTASFNIYLIRPISQGVMTARGIVVHQTKNIFLAESVLFDSEDKQIGRGSGSFVKSQIRLTEEIGYRL